MNRIAIYIDTQRNKGGSAQYSKSLIHALNSLSADNLSITVIYTYKIWGEYLKNFSGIESVFVKKSLILNKQYQFLISLGFLKLAKYFACKFDSEIKIINAKNFDIIIFPAQDAIACLVKTKVIGTIHDLMHRYERRFKESGGFFIYRYRENYFKQLLIISQAVLVDSELGKEHVIESYEQIKADICVLPFIAPDYIYSGDEEKFIPSYVSEMSLKYIFYPALFWPHKNHYNLLKAIKLLKDRGTIVMVVFSGNKRLEYGRLKKFVKANDLENQVKFLGYIPEPEIIGLYKNALAMVMPTYYGPTNIPPIEAILSGCPPLVSNIYGMPTQFGDAALYFNPDDPVEIADKIESIVKQKDLRDNLITQGVKIRGQFSQERFQNDLKNVLEKFLDNQG